MATSIQKNEDINDSEHLRYILMHYVFNNNKTKTLNESNLSENELTEEQVNHLRKELNNFNNFLKENETNHLAKNLTFKPLRLNTDSPIYNKLTRFQKENTFSLYNKRYPKNDIG